MAAKIKPYDEEHGHAINNVLIVFEFSSPLPPHAFERLRNGGDLHGALKKDLPRVVEQQQMLLNFNVIPGVGQPLMPGMPASAPTGIGGISFSKVRPDGEPAMSVNIETNALLIVCGEYDRWAKVSEEVQRYLNILAPWLEGIKVSSVVLQYSDVFNVDFEDQRLYPLTPLFSDKSRYLPPSFANIDDAFHSHHGFFVRPEFKLAGKILVNINVNVNVNVNSAASSYIVNVVTMHKYMLHDAIELVSGNGIDEIVPETLRYLHDESKCVFGDLLTEETKKLIKLETKQGA